MNFVSTRARTRDRPSLFGFFGARFSAGSPGAGSPAGFPARFRGGGCGGGGGALALRPGGGGGFGIREAVVVVFGVFGVVEERTDAEILHPTHRVRVLSKLD